MPLPIVIDGATEVGILKIHLELGTRTENGALNSEQLQLTLQLREWVFSSEGKTGWFEGELLSLQSALPNEAYLKACIACAYSDYSPYGHGSFGCMACFRKLKDDYAKVNDKFDLFPILDKAEVVQETYVCPEFAKRRPNTGYRG
jgi:hypothetical protein